jgi:predicted PurR-regulated permease PerM
VGIFGALLFRLAFVLLGVAAIERYDWVLYVFAALLVIARVPAPIFFGAVTFLFAFIPAIGAAVVSLVAALLLYVTGHPYMAIFLCAWGLVVVGLVDTVVKPLLIRRGMEIHGAIVFFAFIGGLATFGGIGLLVGPLAVSMFLAL